MPRIINPEEMTETSGEGWSVQTVADAIHIGFPAMVARWWTLEAGAKSPAQTSREADELLYVITGTGHAIVDGHIFELDEESVLWLEDGESYHLIAGSDGLQVLQAYAPGEANG